MTYKEIKRLALELFSQKGFEGTIIKDIAEKSRLKPSSIYSHITSKEELFLDILKDCMENSGQSVKSINNCMINEDSCDAGETLRRYHFAITRHFVENKEDYLFLRQAASFTNGKHNLNNNTSVNPIINEATIDFFRSFFMELKQQGRIIDKGNEELFYIYAGTIIAYLEERIVYNIPLDDEHISMFWIGFWKSIKK